MQSPTSGDGIRVSSTREPGNRLSFCGFNQFDTVVIAGLCISLQMPQISKTKSRISKGNTSPSQGGLSSVRALARPDDWAVRMGLRVDARPFSIVGREYVRQVIRDYSPEIVIPKAAQMAFTVTFVTKSLHNVVERGWNGLYLLPVKTGAIPFVQARIDPVIESNDELKHRFSSVDNRLHKQSTAGVNLYVRGTNIARELQEIPVDFEVWDERDRMIEENLSYARHRMDGSLIQKLIILSTPTVEGYGVYAEDAWDATDQHRWEVPCPSCSRFQVLNFEEPDLDYSSLKLGDSAETCVLECAYCHHEITDLERPAMNALGRWTPMNPGGKLRGYHISQFNSPTQRLAEIMKDYFLGQRDMRKLAEFFRQNLGRAYTAKGDKFTPELLDSCRRQGYHTGGIPNSYLAIGIDVGTLLHVYCWHFDAYGRKLLWNIYLMKTFDELDKFLGGLVSWTGIIDAHPEKSKARDLAIKYHGKLRLGFSDDREQASEMATFHPLKAGEAGRVNIDKSMALDTYISDFIDGRVTMPIDARDLGENMPRKGYNGFYHQHLQMVRVEEENTRGTIVARWKKNRNDDHWHHAGMFATMAAQIKPTLMVPASISQALNVSVMG